MSKFSDWNKLSVQEQEFCLHCNGCKYGAEPHKYEPNGEWSEDKEDYVCIALWKKPEELGFIECVGSYKWVQTKKLTDIFSVQGVNLLNQRINQLERELQAEREITDRLRVVETERAERNDELYEALGGLLDVATVETRDDLLTYDEAKEVHSKHKNDYGERPMYYIAVKYSRGLSSQMYSSREKALEENPHADEIIPVRLQENLDEI